MNDSVSLASAEQYAAMGLTADELEELDLLLDDLRTRAEEVPHWEFCDGFLTALVCSRRPIGVAEFLPMLLGEGEALDLAPNEPLPTLPVFADSTQQERFLTLWQQRWDAVEAALDRPENQRTEANAFHPEVEDMRAIIASLPAEEQAALQGQDVPSLGQVWALGFMFAVESWPEEWAAPRDKDVAQWLDDAMECIVTLTEDDTDPPSINMYSEDGPPTTSERRLDQFGDAIGAVYDLRQLWKSYGPRVDTIRKAPAPGRNDTCPCGSGQKYKKCCGA